MPGVKMDSPVKITTRPKVSVMVDAAIKTLAERKGSSLQAINKYIGANYSVDVQKLSFHVKKYLKSAVESGDIVQTSGKGATGSFKMGSKKVEAKPKAPKIKSEKKLKMKTSTPKKLLKPKKATVKPPINSPVEKTNLAGGQEMPVDTTLTKPSKAKKPRFSIPSKSRKSKVSLPAKIKKPKKLMAKGKVAASSEETPGDTMTSPKPVKSKSATKSAKAKKSPKPKKLASNPKKNVSKKTSAVDEQAGNSS